ncbi:MAG: helix-turn-helix domain-containing protein [Dehalococcoidales bacterium]|nr:MAG: helix-turn-helix domain-containing protein [Dehalococcoidales bacterium]
MLEKVNNLRRKQIDDLRNAGLTYAEIGRELGISRERVRQIVSGKSRDKKKTTNDNPDALLRTAEAARMLNVHVNTIRRWSDKELLTALRIGPRGDRRFRLRDIENLLKM